MNSRRLLSHVEPTRPAQSGRRFAQVYSNAIITRAVIVGSEVDAWNVTMSFRFRAAALTIIAIC